MKPPRPPDKIRPGGAAARPGREEGSLGRRPESKRTNDRREVQDFRPRRNATQRSPSWPSPKGSAAADALDAAFVGVSRSFHVVCRKASGREVLFGRYGSRDEAEAAAKLLRWAGGVAVVVERSKCTMNTCSGGER